jgi:ferredoxin
MKNEVYDRLIDSLTLRGGAVFPQKTPEFRALLEELFTEEEADLAGFMPMGSVPAAKIAAAAERPVDPVTATLERMADKGLVVVTERQGVKRYTIPPLVPGVFEHQFMKGTSTERDVKLARLFEDCFEALRRAPGGRVGPSVPFARVIPVEREIRAGLDVHPYEKVSAYIDAAEHIAVSACYCRHHGELVGDPCDKPKDVCLSFGPSAKFFAERGFGRLISKEEAQGVLDVSEEAGLVHCSSNTSAYIDFICNCCLCHCGILKSVKDSQRVSMSATSGYIVEVDRDSCVGCETCVDRCPMEALAMEDGVVARDAAGCIGCGLCVSSCPTEALGMVSRSAHAAPPQDRRELMAGMMASMRK